MQKIVLPINDAVITATYMHPGYKAYWKFAHYGMDLVSKTANNIVYACGDGEVVACGQDGETLSGEKARLGNVIVIIYKDVQLNDGTVRDITSRTYHFGKILVEVGQKVTKNTVIGYYGNTGYKTSGAHLHIEFDSDTKYPTLAYGVSVADINRVINTRTEYNKAGKLVNSSISPTKVWNLDYNQTIANSSSSDWTYSTDLKLNKLEKITVPDVPVVETVPKSQYDDLLSKYNSALAELALLDELKASILDKLSSTISDINAIKNMI